MHRLRSPGTIGQWTVILSVLLVVGPLVQSLAPCGGARMSDAPSSEAVEAIVTPDAELGCAKVAVATTARAVSSEPDAFARGGAPGEGTVRTKGAHSPSPSLKTRGHTPCLSCSPTLDRLRPVVLQI